MRKIRLSVESLEIESFPTAGGGEQVGTVRGHDYSYPNWDCPFSWRNFGCRSVSGEVQCDCLPNLSDVDCA